MNYGWRMRLLWLRILILGGNYGYEYRQPWGVVYYGGWRANLLRLTWKWWREGWGRSHGNGQHVYTWAEFCWRKPHEDQGSCNGFSRMVDFSVCLPSRQVGAAGAETC